MYEIALWIAWAIIHWHNRIEQPIIVFKLIRTYFHCAALKRLKIDFRRFQVYKIKVLYKILFYDKFIAWVNNTQLETIKYKGDYLFERM